MHPFVSGRLNVAMGCKARGSNPDLGENFGTRQFQPLAPTGLLCNGLYAFTGGGRGYSGRIVALTIHPHLAAKLKKEKLYVYSPLCLRDLS